jgi:hypothetical protein
MIKYLLDIQPDTWEIMGGDFNVCMILRIELQLNTNLIKLITSEQTTVSGNNSNWASGKLVKRKHNKNCNWLKNIQLYDSALVHRLPVTLVKWDIMPSTNDSVLV